VTSSQEVVNITLSISHTGVKFCRSASNVSKLWLFVVLINFVVYAVTSVTCCITFMIVSVSIIIEVVI